MFEPLAVIQCWYRVSAIDNGSPCSMDPFKEGIMNASVTRVHSYFVEFSNTIARDQSLFPHLVCVVMILHREEHASAGRNVPLLFIARRFWTRVSIDLLIHFQRYAVAAK